MGKKYDDWAREELLKEVKQLAKHKKYGLVWENKDEKVVELCKTQLPTLEEVKEKQISDQNASLHHFLIEGDNYHSLSVLNYTHAKKVDLIYIDPPYNTGNKDFIFNDHYVDKEDAYRHSKWLSFMAKRLTLAKSLLKNTGVIFISINDVEQAQLKMLCNEVLGENNFVGQFIWRKKEGGGQTDNYFVTEHEYVLVYAKSSNFSWLDELIPDSEANFNKSDDEGSYTAVKLAKWGNSSRKEDRPKMHFPIKAPNGKNVYPVAPDGSAGRWRVGKVKMAQLIKAQLVEWQEKDGRWIAYEKIYFDGEKIKKIKERSILYELATTADGTNELTAIFGKKDTFDNPKPTELIKFFLRHGANSDAIVLDFFAGSGTTAQAVVEMNEEDGGLRQFIICTNNENNNGSKLKIATDICYPRIKGMLNSKSGAGDFRYYKTRFVKKVITDKDKRDFVHQATEMLCLSEYTFTPLLVEEGKFALFENAKQATGIIYDEDNIDKFKEAANKIDKPLVIYVFSYDSSYDEDDFADIKDLIKVKPIPAVILNVYEKIARENTKRINL